MILTCPACATQYAVKDGAIPAGGRQVRCASCKHSWHQDAEVAAPDQALPEDAMPETGIAPPTPSPREAEPPLAEVPQDAARSGMIAQEPMQSGALQPDGEAPGWANAPGSDQSGAEPVIRSDPHLDRAALDQHALQSDAPEAHHPPQDEEFDAIPAFEDEEEGGGRRRLGLILGLVLLVVAAAAAFWFLAPPEYKARAGIAAAGETPLELMLTTSDRQKLASGNELLAISGRIINPTDREQAVPPIKAELRNKATRQIIYSWTIAPPARVLPARGSASFNSAEIDIPQGGDELTVTLGERAS